LVRGNPDHDDHASTGTEEAPEQAQGGALEKELDGDVGTSGTQCSSETYLADTFHH
jgi:hypothetical protein